LWGKLQTEIQSEIKDLFICGIFANFLLAILGQFKTYQEFGVHFQCQNWGERWNKIRCVDKALELPVLNLNEFLLCKEASWNLAR
jgi:hypothetical protein